MSAGWIKSLSFCIHSWEQQKWLRTNFLSIVFILCDGAEIKGPGGKDTLFYTIDEKQKGTSVKNISITLLINTCSNLKEKFMRIK